MEKFLNIESKRKQNEDNCKEENKRKFRKYDNNYLDFGFTYITIDNEERPKYIICLKVLAADSMVPNKLKRHLKTNHSTLSNKSRDYFVRQLAKLEKQSSSFVKQTSVPYKVLLASYKVAIRIEKCKKPHTIAEELIFPSAIDMVSTLIRESVANRLKNIPLSNNTISRQIQDISDNINDQLIDKLRNKNFAIQLDEATDNNKDAYLICYLEDVRRVGFNFVMEFSYSLADKLRPNMKRPQAKFSKDYRAKAQPQYSVRRYCSNVHV
ncbi:hypothetical protein QTP88_017810 [Uroleucon formosanum]